MSFSLERFEAFAYARDREMGMRELVALLGDLDNHYGLVGDAFQAKPLEMTGAVRSDENIWTRVAAAASCLLTDKQLYIAEEWKTRVLTLQRWLSALFAATPLINLDHAIRALNQAGDDNDGLISFAKRDLVKLCLLYTSESEIPLDLDALWAADRELTAGLCMVLLSPRFLASPAAHQKREVILPWLSKRLYEIDSLDNLPQGVLHDVYMHCSYADRRDKHDVKRPINALIRRRLRQAGLKDSTFASSGGFQRGGKPTMLVVLEWFTKGHSIYRTHSRTMEMARRHFHVVAMAYANCIDETTERIFDEVVPIEPGAVVEQLSQIQQEAARRNAVLMYMPSVGMFHLTMWLSNLRVTPIQVMALGHPATTHSDAIDYVVVEEDYVGDERCFSEKLLKLPSDGMPYRPSADAHGLEYAAVPRLSPDKVKIAVCSTTMKLNPRFLQACAQIARMSTVPVEFHFLIGQAQGLVYPNVVRVVKGFLGDSVVIYRHQPYKEYMHVISGCDLFINPFPFGNTNGIIDTVSVGLIGVCLTGAEVHEHIDQGLFERLGFPDWLVARTVDEYVGAVVRLAEGHAERAELSRKLAGPEAVKKIFTGRPEIMGDKFLGLVESMMKG